MPKQIIPSRALLFTHNSDTKIKADYNVRTFTKAKGAWSLDQDANDRNLNADALIKKLHEYIKDPKALTPIYVQHISQAPSSGSRNPKPFNLTAKPLKHNPLGGLEGIPSKYLRITPLDKSTTLSDAPAHTVNNKVFDLAPVDSRLPLLSRGLASIKDPIQEQELILVKDSASRLSSPFNMFSSDMKELTKLFDFVDKLTIIPASKN